MRRFFSLYHKNKIVFVILLTLFNYLTNNKNLCPTTICKPYYKNKKIKQNINYIEKDIIFEKKLQKNLQVIKYRYTFAM